MELPSATNAAPPPEFRRRLFSWIFDFLFLVGIVAVFSHVFLKQWRPLLHLGLPLLLLPLTSYLFHRLFGKTPGQLAFGIEWRGPGGIRARRVYDWLFALTLKRSRPALGVIPQIILSTSVLAFAFGANAFRIVQDPELRPFTKGEVPLFAPDAKEASWIALPFFYATGAIPIGDTEFGLPYERGPPNRFIGKITLYWRGLDSRLTLTGPLTLGEPSTQAELKDCLSRWMGCPRVRRKLWQTSVGSFFEGREILKSEWFTVENEFLPTQERAQGIYLRSSSDRGRIREAYFLVGPKMAVQGFILDRPDRTEGENASQRLAKIIGSIRLSEDLAAPRAFINPKLAALKIGPQSSLTDLISAEGHLLAKTSIEPKEAESFYHLAGLAITLYRRAKKEGHIELTASSKIIVKSALQFVKDINPESKRLPEMENFSLETE